MITMTFVGDFFHYWSQIVQRSKLSYKYDNYCTSGNTGSCKRLPIHTPFWKKFCSL